MRKAFILFLIINTIAFVPVISQTNGIPSAAPLQVKDGLLTKLNHRKDSVMQNGGLWVTPYLTPGYTPEMGATLSGGGLISFKTNPKDTLIQRSSIPFTVGMTTTSGYFAIARFNSYWNQDKLRLSSDFTYKSMPDNYWGVGYENGRDTEVSDSTTAYNRNWLWFATRVSFKLAENLYAGPILDINMTKASDYTNDDGSKKEAFDDEDFNNNSPWNVGLGAMLEYDSRDVAVNAWNGIYLRAGMTLYGNYFGGQNNYQAYEFDYRHYKTVSKPGRTLVWTVKGRTTKGDIPWAEMSQLGTPYDLRGYTWGRYRDNAMALGMVEYRHTFYKRDGKRSKHGIVLWSGVGSVASSFGEMSNWLPNAGIGYRFEVQKRMNLRIDFGIGKQTNGTYINFNEAF